MTKELRDFIDHVIVPTLVERFVREQQAAATITPAQPAA
jgi:hypothetical protein